MSNTFLTPSALARDASIILSDNLVAAQLVNRGYEASFANKIGDSIAITVPPIATARDFIDDGSVTDADITETSLDLELTEQPYVAHTLTTKELSLELDDFNTVVTSPAILAIRDKCDSFIIDAAVAGFNRNLVGTAGNSPSTMAHLAAGVKELNDNGAPTANRVGILDTSAHASLIQLSQFTNADYGSDKPSGLKEAALTRVYGCDWYMSQNAGTQVRGDVAQATTLDGVPVLAASTLTIDDAAGGSVGTIKKGARFIVTGDTATLYYTVTSDITAAGGTFVVPVTPVVNATTVALGTNVAITWTTAVKEDVVFCKSAMAAAIVAPAPLSIGSAIGSYNGINVRVTMSTSTSSLSDQVVYDVYLGSVCVSPQAGIVLNG